MFNFKKFFAGLIGVSLFICALATLQPLTSQGQGNNSVGPPFGLRRFYLTQAAHNGSEVLTACAAGYHMASLWEILDPSHLSYNAELGFTTADSGFGPPANYEGWIRTGFDSHSTMPASPGFNNCQAWTSASNTDHGTYVFLPSAWDTTYDTAPISPWVANNSSCAAAGIDPIRVWCVHD